MVVVAGAGLVVAGFPPVVVAAGAVVVSPPFVVNGLAEHIVTVNPSAIKAINLYMAQLQKVWSMLEQCDTPPQSSLTGCLGM